MKVAILFSGGKDSTLAVEYCMQQGWEIAYLLSVKPSRTDCYLYHFANVEHTPVLADALGLKHILKTCDVADPKKEAWIVSNVVAENPVDAVVLGGVGLQETQIKSVKEALAPLGVEAFASHAGQDHGEILRDMIERGYDIRVGQYAVDGLSPEWLGRQLDEDAFEELKEASEKYGFHVGGEGGHYDTFVLDGPIFRKQIHFADLYKVKEGKYSGYLVVKKLKVVPKERLVRA